MEETFQQVYSTHFNGHHVIQGDKRELNEVNMTSKEEEKAINFVKGG
jgi:hypothetical protein